MNFFSNRSAVSDKETDLSTATEKYLGVPVAGIQLLLIPIFPGQNSRSPNSLSINFDLSLLLLNV